MDHAEISFLHFNDVYHITQPTALGRLSHVFRTAKDVPEAERPITVFSGDAFSPSLESAVMKGAHMVPVLNHLLIDVACYGNHDFDFGEDVLVDLSQGCPFPWLLANAVHADGRLMATAKAYLVLEKKGYRIGFVGLAGTDWPSNCQHLPADGVILDPVSVARRVSKRLRETYGVDIVIAVTHMRQEEDVHLAQSCDGDIDLILGGHDHDLTVHGVDLTATASPDADTLSWKGHIKLVKSGTDFKSYSDIQMGLTRNHDGKATVRYITVTQTRDITLSDQIPDERGMHDILAQLQTRIADRVDRPLFYSAVPLEGRTSIVRTEETNLGNMVADAVRAYYNADIALINSGSLRCDRVIDAGVITVKDMIDIVPFGNPFVVKRLLGGTIAEALENAACDIIDGRFVQVSGITFRIDPQGPIGARVHGLYLAPGHTSSPTSGAPGLMPESPTAPQRVPLRTEKEYAVVMIGFIAAGFDGYTRFREAPTIVGEEAGVTDSSLFLQLFRRNTTCGVYGTESDSLESDASMARARATIVLGTSAGELPLVGPSVQGRIKYMRRCPS